MPFYWCNTKYKYTYKSQGSSYIAGWQVLREYFQYLQEGGEGWQVLTPLHRGEDAAISELVRSRFIATSIPPSPEQHLLVLPSLKPSPALGNTVQFSNSWIFVNFHQFYFLKLSNIPAKLLMDLHFQIQLIRQQFSVKLTTLALPSLFLWRDRFLKLFELLQSYSGFTILQWQKKFWGAIKGFSLISSTWKLFLTSFLWWQCHRRGVPHHLKKITGSANGMWQNMLFLSSPRRTNTVYIRIV